MPVPKGINTPAVREAWLAERRAVVEEFNRLVGKGVSECKAARALALGLSCIPSLLSPASVAELGGVRCLRA